jgi:metallophosphoesterase superfamily enzyme
MQGCFLLPDPFAGFQASPHRCLWHDPTRTAVLADLHLGAETSLARQGLYIPDTSSAAIRRGWQEIASLKPARIVLAGDVFDSKTPDAGAIALFRDLVSAVSGVAITLLPGNHDPEPDVLAALVGDLPVTVAASTAVAGIPIIHGHQSADARGIGDGQWSGPPEEPRRHWIPAGLVVGHQHPAVILSTRVRSAKMICYALCVLRVGRARVPLLVLPPFSPLPLGSNLLTSRNWILDLPAPAGPDVRILGIVDRQVLDFGPLDGLAGS